MTALLAALLLPAPLPVGAAFEEVAAFPAPEAHQAVAVDADHFYAIGNRVVAKYDKRTGAKVAEVRASRELPLVHMNGGAVIGDDLVVSHSNFPFTPATGSVELFSTADLSHRRSLSLGPTDGSLTAVLPVEQGMSPRPLDAVALFRERGTRVFAHYELPRLAGYATGTDRTRLEVRAADIAGFRFVLPPTVVRRLRPHSVSGASYDAAGRLWLSGHDRPELYRVSLPRAGSELVLDAVHPAPIAGQGIAWDPAEPGVLWGTRRREGLVVRMRLTEAP